MHDPQTLAFELSLPTGRNKSIPLVAIWHVDPCRGASDDSCGFTFPRLTPKQRQAMKDLAFFEGTERHFLRYPFKTYSADVADREALYRALILMVARMLRLQMTFDEAAKMASEKMGVGGCESLDGTFCFVAGYHSNHSEDRSMDRVEHWQRTCCAVARQILYRRRKWWQHPRWHVHHWRIQWIFVQTMNRWLSGGAA